MPQCPQDLECSPKVISDKLEEVVKPSPSILPITSEINGEWFPVRCDDSEEYLKRRNAGQSHDTVFLHANQLITSTDKKMTQNQKFGNKILIKFDVEFNKMTHRKGVHSVTFVDKEEKIIRTKTIYHNGGGNSKMNHIEERFIEEGKLYIANYLNTKKDHRWDLVKCTRIYEKVKQPKKDQAIKMFIEGKWRQIGLCGLEEFCDNVKMPGLERMLWDKETHIIFSILDFFNEIHISHSIIGKEIKLEVHHFKEEVDQKNDSPGTVFTNQNTLVTVVFDRKGKKIMSKTNRYLNNGKLFISFTQNGFNFIGIYEKI